MGVPAFFRWLSRKYPKTITHVAEDKPSTMVDSDGNEYVVPVDISTPNPNGFEIDNLYLDMNGIVHPCTHPEGKPAPSSEQEMMLEIFKYTERVVNMTRPRKVLFMAIDGVAPRAKMNQQRSRRFRTAQEAKEKEEQRLEGIALFEAMGKSVSEDTKDTKAWDTNAITPGTPFMQLLADSLRYWVVSKLNNDPGWQNLEVIISDASVPGEGEHKIMDFIRRQRISPLHDPNTQHVIYGLDADLIMLALATHEPQFRVLREDVFSQDNQKGCRICGQEGHFAAQCTVDKSTLKDPVEKIDKPLADAKPFIFLDVSILREYLEIELDVRAPFQFDFERAIDDWVLLIFFVGNDFLPHLPSLEIREGAIDMLVGIWKRELHNMRGYLTNHGHIELERAQVILNALARREDEIFRRRRDAEERQDQNAKRRKLEVEASLTLSTVEPAMKPEPVGFPVDSIPGLVPQPPDITTAQAEAPVSRESVREANLRALKALKNEKFIPADGGLTSEGSGTDVLLSIPVETTVIEDPPESGKAEADVMETVYQDDAVDILPSALLNDRPADVIETVYQDGAVDTLPSALLGDRPADHMDIDASDAGSASVNDDKNKRGAKRTFEEMDEGNEEATSSDESEPSIPTLKVNPDGTVEQLDTVRLWEPGYKERYYRQKFKIDAEDVEARKKIVKHYMEGLSWVLHYYYQGTPSWHWFYPYHFAPFASDFEDIQTLDIKFERGAPFKPFEQLMGVFPPASRHNIPIPLQDLMVNPNSPIIDFYPETFDIDMNGKKMAWQGVALLPFIEERRLLTAVEPLYSQLTKEEEERNSWGNNELFVSDSHPLFDVIAPLYARKKGEELLAIDATRSYGLAGSIKSAKGVFPGSTYISPLEEAGQKDIEQDRSISALYFYPKQTIPHRSRLLPNVRLPNRVLDSSDYEHVQRGGRGRGNNYHRNDQTSRGSYQGFDSRRGYVHNYGYTQTYSNGSSWRGRGGSRGEPDYSYGANGGGYRGLPPRGIGRGRGYGRRGDTVSIR